jgi:SAM-dependent methyltransferase
MELMLKRLRRMRRGLRPFLRKFAGVPQTLLEEMPNCPALFITYRNLIATGHKRVPGGWIYEGEYYPDYLTLGGASFAIHRTAQKYCRGQGLDIGAGYWPLRGSTPIDTELGLGTENKIEHIPENSQDYVFSSHCLEHIREWQKTLDSWISKVKPGGILFLYLPHPSCKLWHMSNPLMASMHKWVPTPGVIERDLRTRGLEVVDKDEGPDHFYSFYVCARKPDLSMPSILATRE